MRRLAWVVVGAAMWANGARAEGPPGEARPEVPATAPEERAREDRPLEATPLDPWMPLTFEDEAHLRDLLWRQVILLAARPRTSDLEEPGLAPVQVGQAVRVDGDLLCTAMLLLEGATEARVTGPDGREQGTTVKARDAEALVAWLPCEGPCRAWPRLHWASDASRDPGRGLFLVLPSLPDQPVLSPTVSLGTEASPYPGLFAVAGRLPPGTLVFDGAGSLVGLVVRGHPQRTDRSLAVPAAACRPRPGSPAAPEGTP